MTIPAALLLGVDGGGTKTDVMLADSRGVELATARTTGTNHETIGAEQVAAKLGEAIGQVLTSVGATSADVRVAVFGLAGIDWPADVTTIGDALRSIGLGGTTLVLNDSDVALRAGCSRPWGLVSNVGTGAVTAGINRAGDRFRTMAIGFGEPSGASTIVRSVLDAVAAEYHGSGPATALTPVVLEHLGCTSVPELFEALTRGRVTVGSRHAPLLDRGVEQGDAVALELLTRLAHAHADMVEAVARQLAMVDDDFEVVLSGGVHQASAPFRAAFAARVVEQCPAARPTLLAVPPVRGAIQLALDLAGGTTGDSAGLSPAPGRDRGAVPSAAAR